MRNLIYTGLLSADRRLPYISDNAVVRTSINFIKQQQSFSFGNYRTHIKRKSASNSECSDIESKTLIIQLERQIREKDKTIKLLKQLNDAQTIDPQIQMEKDKINEQYQYKQSHASENCKSCDSTESRLRQMEFNMFQNMTLMTNCNVQMATQMQNLSSQVTIQTQNMFLQQQLLNGTNMNTHTYGGMHPPSHMPFTYGFNINQYPLIHGFNINHPQVFYQRPTFNPYVFYQRPAMMNPHVYVPAQRTVHTHPPTYSQVQQQQVSGYPPGHGQQITQQQLRVPDLEPVHPVQSTLQAEEKIQQDKAQESECQLAEPVTFETQTQQYSERSSPIVISPVQVGTQRNDIESSNGCRLTTQVGSSQATEPKSDDVLQDDKHTCQSTQEQKDLNSSFLCIPSRKHMPPDNHVLLSVEKSTKRH